MSISIIASIVTQDILFVIPVIEDFATSRSLGMLVILVVVFATIVLIALAIGVVLFALGWLS